MASDKPFSMALWDFGNAFKKQRRHSLHLKQELAKKVQRARKLLFHLSQHFLYNRCSLVSFIETDFIRWSTLCRVCEVAHGSNDDRMMMIVLNNTQPDFCRNIGNGF
jgi:hypothetical protein